MSCVMRCNGWEFRSGRDEMTSYEQIERGMDAGSQPGILRAGEQLGHHFTAILAHELRSPLASMLMDVQTMRHGRLDEAAARRACDRAERQVMQMSRIIEDLLAIFRTGQGK